MKREVKEMSVVEGTVENIIYRNDETGYAVLELDREGELLTVVGLMPMVAEGEQLRVLGSHTTHPQFGPQFRAEVCERRLPANANAIYRYLSSGVIKGIGPATAKRIVDLFGDETLDIIENSPEELRKIKGISAKKAAEISAEFLKIYGMKNVMAFLSGYGIEPFYCVALWKKYGVSTIERVRENPFLICADDIGLPFETADAICRQLEIPQDSEFRLSAGIFYVLRHNTYRGGHTCLPRTKLLATAANLLQCEAEGLEDILEQEIGWGNLVLEEIGGREYIYAPALYEAELYVAERVGLIASHYPDTGEDYGARIAKLEREKGMEYAALQRRAISAALTQGITILTGGPGTGKTTAINAIIRLMEDEGLKVAIAAPTGRAAKRISELTGYEAKTLHRLLEVDFGEGELPGGDGGRTKFKRCEHNPLDCDAIIVDEMSMVDILLFESLLHALKLSTKIVLVGDSDQLPSVGAGKVLGDLIKSDCVTTTCLTEIFRQAAQSQIVVGAHSIVRGEMPDLRSRDGDFFFLANRGDYAAAARTVCDLCVRRLPNAYGYDPFGQIQVLAPSRVGELGTNHLNQLLQEALNPSGEGKPEVRFESKLFRQGDKVMQIRNNYDIEWVDAKGEVGLGMFNGDIGIIQKVDRGAGTVTILFDDRTAEYAREMLGELELAYAVTVHKSQGSEFDAVVLPLMNAHEKLYYRNLLYTAVTRAKKLLILLGKEYTVRAMVENNRKTLRYTHLAYFLRRFHGLA